MDFLKIKKLKNLKVFKLYNDSYFGNKILNPIEIINCSKLETINLPIKIDVKILKEIFDKISSDRTKFLLNKNQDSSYKNKDLIDSRYDLNEEDKKKYDEIKEQDERKIDINGDDLSNTIFALHKKKTK